jgi:hypothetical protein
MPLHDATQRSHAKIHGVAGGGRSRLQIPRSRLESDATSRRIQWFVEVCGNTMRVPQPELEARALGAIRERILIPEWIAYAAERALKRVADGLRIEDPDAARARLEEIDGELENLARFAGKTGKVDKAAELYAELERERAVAPIGHRSRPAKRSQCSRQEATHASRIGPVRIAERLGHHVLLAPRVQEVEPGVTGCKEQNWKAAIGKRKAKPEKKDCQIGRVADPRIGSFADKRLPIGDIVTRPDGWKSKERPSRNHDSSR